MSREVGTKEKVVEAAVRLFNTNGYDGTSIRDIAREAGVNNALISYYFNGKKGLLEFLMTYFLEGYIREIEKVLETVEERPIRKSLLLVIENLLKYQQKNHQVARFVHREMTIDSILVRELMSSYLTKEKYYFQRILKEGIDRMEFNKFSIPFVCIQLRNFIVTPFLNPQYIQEVYQIGPQDPYFLKNYQKLVEAWIKNTIITNNRMESKKFVLSPSIAMKS